MNAAAATLAVTLAASAGCGPDEVAGGGRPEPPDLAGLRAALEGDVAAIAVADPPPVMARAVVAGRQVPVGAWPALVTAPFRSQHPLYAAGFVVAAPAFAAELAGARGPIDVRWQYADDPRLASDQARLRVALPVGRPGAIVTVGGRALSPVFAHDGRRWRALAGLDQAIALRLAARAPACVASYQAAAREPCLAMSAPVIDAVLADRAGDDDALDRACTRLRLNGC